MRSLGKIFIYALVVLIAGALAAPQAWRLIHALPADWFGHGVGALQRMPFHRYLSRSIQVAALVLLWPLLRSLHVRSIREFGLVRSPCPGRDAGAGLAAGLTGVLLLMVLQIWSGARVFHDGFALFTLPRIAMTAVVVAFLEEWLFRGVVLGYCRQFLAPPAAVFLSALLFALVHFVSLPSTAGEGAAAPLWWSGFTALGSIGQSMPPWHGFLWAFATLCTAGSVLGWMTLRTGSLLAPMALHASWVLGQQVSNLITASAGSRLPLAGAAECHGMVPTGLIPVFCILLAGLLVARILWSRPRPPRFPHHVQP